MSRDLPWEYLETCSQLSLENFMLLRQNIAANLKKSMAKDFEEILNALVDAEIAWLLINRREVLGNVADARQRLLEFNSEVMLSERLKRSA